MARLRDGGSGCPGHRQRATKEADSIISWPGKVDIETPELKLNLDAAREAERFVAELSVLLHDVPKARVERIKQAARSFVERTISTAFDRAHDALCKACNEAARDATKGVESALRDVRHQVVDALIRGFEAEEALEQHEHCGTCPSCDHQLECPRCNSEMVCSSCGDEVAA